MPGLKKAVGVILQPMHQGETKPPRKGFYLGIPFTTKEELQSRFGKGMWHAVIQEGIRADESAEAPTEKEFWETVKTLAEKKLRLLNKVVLLPDHQPPR